MANSPPARLDLAALLAAVEEAPPVAAAEVLGARLAHDIGARDVNFLIADFSGEALVRLGHAGAAGATRTHGRETGERVALAGTPQGRALAAQACQRETGDDGTWVFAPVTNRGEAIGVLELRLDERPDERTLDDIALAAHALAYVVIANRRFTDLFEWGQRSIPLSLAAEIQHRLLPGSYTCEGGQFTLAGWLEPAGEIGGDTFDFTLERDVLHLSMTDAMGHEVNAALLATVLVGALRNARRRGTTLGEQADAASDDLAAHAPHAGFVTGQLVRVDLRAGTASVVNAGHPPPLRLRAGRIERVPLEADPPFGTVRGHPYSVQRLPLEPGDRLLFFTDGVIERNHANVDLEAMLADTAGLHPREAIQQIIHAVLRATDHALDDDATALCLDWHGGTGRGRRTDSGADE